MEFGGYTLIYLDPDAQINLVVEKIRESSSFSLAFVAHDRSPLLYSSVNLELIKKRLKEEGKEGVFITSNPQLQSILRRESWKVYSHIDDLEGENLPEVWELEEGGRIEIPNKKRGRALRSFLFLLFIGFLFLIYLNSRAVVIEITPSRKIYTQEMVFSGDVYSKEPSIEERVLPLQRIPFSQEITQNYPATGERVVGTAKARGVARFINEERERAYIPSGSLLRSRGGMEFVTVSDVWAPGVQLEYLLDVVMERRAGWIDVNIEATELGEIGNVMAGEIREWDGSANLQVINPEETRGGMDETIMVITEEDLERGREEMERRLLSYIEERMEREIQGDHIVVRDLNDQGLITIEANKEPLEEGALFYLTGRIEGEVIYLYKEDLEYLVAKSYTNGLDGGYKISERPLEIESIFMEESEEDSYSIYLSIAGEVVALVDTKHLESAFKGEPIEAAQELLRAMPEIDQFRIVGQDRERLPSFALGLRVIIED